VARLVFSPRANADLEEIGDFIARDNPVRAAAFVEELHEHCAAILAAPASYAPREELGAGVRMAVHGRYLILFRANGDVVRIERVLHSARRRPRSV
jgi:toxin ParE1/3/4